MKLYSLLFLSVILLGALLAPGADTPALPTLTTVRQVRELSQNEATRGYPVRLRGVLTFHDWEISFLQDATGGLYVRNTDPDLRAGTEVEVEGFTEGGRTLPIVTGPGIDGGQAKIRALGPAQWPQPMKAVAASLGEEVYDAQWISVSGNLISVARSHDGVMLDLLSEGVLVQAAIPRWPQNWVLPGYLRGLQITVRGVVSRKPAQSDSVAKAADTVLCVPSLEMIEVAPQSVNDLFQWPQTRFIDLYQISTWEKPMVRIHGQARFVRPGLGFFVLMAGGPGKGGIVWVQTSAPEKLVAGDWVDAVGWYDVFDGRQLITDAYFRVEKPGTPSPYESRKASDVKADPVANHGVPITVLGRLVEQQKSVSEESLVLEDQGVTFLARLQHDGAVQLPVFERGMKLRLAGMCVAKRMPFPENLPATFAFQLWLSSPSDVKILQRPPWWTIERISILCAGFLVLGLLAVGWAVLLRRQVARQSAVIGSQMERQAIAQERARIARELHDSLGQELVGIALQLDSAALRLYETPEHAERALNMARTMIRHSQAETKRSVSDLRAGELDISDLPAALNELVQPLVATAGSTQLHLEVEGTPRRLAGVLEHHLLRIGQETVANAVRHGHAEKIDVRICYRENEVVIEVKDNGGGFDTTEAMAVASSHFGLLGLRERANKLQGRLKIDSKVGAGTVVSVTVPLNTHSTT
ncbi:MAG: sensor histidine kinase [Verrucomicrobiota bacterium]